MLKKEYIVFTAFLLSNVLLALNCFTTIAYERSSEIAKNNYEKKIAVIHNEKTLFRESERSPLPEVGVYWDSNNQIQVSFFKLYKKHFCIDIIKDKDDYLNPEIFICEKRNEEKFNPIYKIEHKTLEEAVKKNISQIQEIFVNTNYPQTLIFLLKNKSYMIFHKHKYGREFDDWKILNAKDIDLIHFLDNKEKTVTRQKINTMLEIKLYSESNRYIAFFYRENAKHRIVSVEWEVVETIKESQIGKFILWTGLIPVGLALDILLSPITVPLWIILMILVRSR